MRTVIAAILILLLATAQAETRYVLRWESQLPVRVGRIEVTGGAIERAETASDGLSGEVEASAPRACLSITVGGQTTNGIPILASRSWSDGCERVYLPAVSYGR